MEHKRTLLAKLDQLLACPYGAKATKGDGNLQRIVNRASMVHLCHLDGAGDLMDWLPALLRTAGRHNAARARMSRWGQEDPARLRQVTYHSAQILSISRSFPFNTPSESFYVFYAGAALWCAAILLEKPDDAGVEMRDDESPALFLNVPKMAKETDIQRIQQWLCEGVSVRLGVYGVPDLGSQESRVQVLQETLSILQNMRTWGLSKAFSEVIRQLILVEYKDQA